MVKKSAFALKNYIVNYIEIEKLFKNLSNPKNLNNLIYYSKK